MFFLFGAYIENDNNMSFPAMSHLVSTVRYRKNLGRMLYPTCAFQPALGPKTSPGRSV